MQPFHLLLVLVTVTVWGCNFVVIAWGLRGLPPVLFAALRFACAAVPLAALRPRPRVPWRLLAGYAICMYVAQFPLLFLGMKLGVPAGLASLALQLQAFFTVALAAAFLGERVRPAAAAGGAMALAGMVLAATRLPARGPLPGFLLVLAAALAWAAGNLLAKRLGPVDPLALVGWGSLLAAPCLFGASLLLEGPAAILSACRHLSPAAAGAVLFQAYPATVFGFGTWSFLLRRYPAPVVAPFALLVPVVAMVSGATCLGEPMPWWKLAAALLMAGGLALGQIRRPAPAAPPRAPGPSPEP